MEPTSPTVPGQHAGDPRRWVALTLLCLAQFMLILDVTAANVALPSIGAELGMDRAELTWVLTSYVLTFGGLMLLGGRLADLLGRRRMLLAGLLVFTAGAAARSAAGRPAGPGAGAGHHGASGIVNTGHELGGAIGVAVVSTVAAGSLVTPATDTSGFSSAFTVLTVVAMAVALMAVRLVPPGRPSSVVVGHGHAH